MEKMIEEILSGGYKSPIEIITGQMRTEFDDGIYKAVQDYGVNVDKDELIRALQYDRWQFDAGYRARDKAIVRCKDCEHGQFMASCSRYMCHKVGGSMRYSDDYCNYGKRKETNEKHS